MIITSEDTGSVGIQCVFASESTAQGCHVTFTDIDQGLTESFNITSNDTITVSLSASGNYTVAAFDIINGSFMGPSIQQLKLLEVVVAMPLQSSNFLTTTSIGNFKNFIT